jgi:hypothetical protein
MKRSEMENEIYETLNGFYNYGEEPDVEGDRLKARVILAMIERKGMLPPTVCFLATNEYSSLRDLVNQSEYDCVVEWEPEEVE